jgi:hypothetical protein
MLDYFRHRVIETVVHAFGTLFNDIWVAKYDVNGEEVERYKVPIAYGPKQKWVSRIEQEDPELIRSYEMHRPRIGYEMTNISYDPVRKKTTMRRLGQGTDSNTTLTTRYESVPYNLTFMVHIVTKNQEEAYQILEQILPYFGPDFCITFRNFPVDRLSDVPIQIGPINLVEDYEGNFETRKSTVISIQFVAKVNFYGPTVTSKIITVADVNVINMNGATVSGSTGQFGTMDLLTITGATFASVQVGVTGGATAGSIGQITITGTPGTTGYSVSDGTYTTITEYPGD